MSPASFKQKPIWFVSCWLLIMFGLLTPIHTHAESQPDIVLHLFYSSACSSCHEAMTSLLEVAKLRPELKITYHNLLYPNEEQLKQAFCRYYRVPSKYMPEFPLAFVGDQYLRENQMNETYLNPLIKMFKRNAIHTPAEKDILALKRAPDKRLTEIKVVTIIIAGLIDGINPCAFLTLTFLMSLLYVQHASRKKIIIISIFYTAAVFLTYLAAGMGLSTLIGSLEKWSWLLEVLQFAIGMAAIFFGLQSFRDFSAMRRGEYQEVALKLPERLKGAIRRTLKKGSTAFLLPLGAAAAGMVVSLLEFMCTGQVYLPTLIYMRTIAALQSKAFILLVLYNLAFIMPLIVVFLITLIGISSFRLVKFGNRFYPIAKLALGFIFLILGVFLIDSVARVLF